MKNLKTRLVGADSVMAVTMRQGKSGINVAATIRTPGVDASTGSKSSHKTEALAKTAFDKIVSEAKAIGWTPKVSTGGGQRSTFTSIPAPAAADPAKVAAQKRAKAERAVKRAANKAAKAAKAKKLGK